MTSIQSKETNEYFEATLVLNCDQPLPIYDLGEFIIHFGYLYYFYLVFTDDRFTSLDSKEKRSLIAPFSRYRRENDINVPDGMLVTRITQHSPLELAAVVPIVGGTIAALWAAVQIIEKISLLGIKKEGLKLDNEKKQLEVEKLKKELGIELDPVPENKLIEVIKDDFDLLKRFGNVQADLATNEIKLVKYHFKRIGELPYSTKKGLPGTEQ